MIFEKREMSRFTNDDTSIAYFDAGNPDGFPVVLIHGFASSAQVNWVSPGWVKTLGDEGYRVVALDNRGHGESDKPHDAGAYDLSLMAGDVVGLMDHLAIGRAHIFGYSMGARITAAIALGHSGRTASLVFGGLGDAAMRTRLDWELVSDALLARSIDEVQDDRARRFRAFADQTKSDRIALAACIRSTRDLLTVEDLRRIDNPALVAVGTKDDIGGDPEPFADALPGGRVFRIENRDHMLAVGDKSFKAAVVEFLETTGNIPDG
jgi:pimeloyl-ACP methyl ester carboxylesterase